ncbi:hypothetical protein BDA96_01G382400 [Sorghum bicolor]|uniref:Uncharacterized protein n=2 Tax=Sorghum bicolor TaxID=4558 RepID=A0A921S3N3_SORBI|nr:hypothetical protein BDA96_01G382400 [Sorghum bicolor]OQU92530.1 hypothetical protein SORBI_3001G358366 [Sorghum bicolor]
MFPNSINLTTVQYVLINKIKIHAWRAPVVTDHTATRGVAQTPGSSGGWSAAAAAAVAPKAAPTASILGNFNAPSKPKVGATGHSRPSARKGGRRASSSPERNL